jgi:hypothetical protein
MILELLTMRIMETSTTGRSMAFMTWVQMVMAMSGAPGNRMMPTDTAIMNVNKA